VSEATSYEDYHLVNVAGLLPDDVDRVKAYQKNRVKLVLSLLTIMDKCHAQNILHNDLSPSNIMLHFPPGKLVNVYIEVCNWGMASRVKEKKASLYGYQKKKRRLQILHSGSMWHLSCSMFSGPRVLVIRWRLCKRSTCIPRPRMHIQLACWQA
jgi:serine/threonine protein kinase